MTKQLEISIVKHIHVENDVPRQVPYLEVRDQGELVFSKRLPDDALDAEFTFSQAEKV